MVVPVIVVGLQSINGSRTRANGNGAQRNSTSASPQAIPQPDSESCPQLRLLPSKTGGDQELRGHLVDLEDGLQVQIRWITVVNRLKVAHVLSLFMSSEVGRV